MGLRTKWRPGDDFLLRLKDSHVVVVEKKAGMLTHAGPEQDEKSLLQSLRHFLGPRNYLRAVHRLDRVVSGLLVFARSERAFEALFDQFKQRSVERRYQAAVATAPPTSEGTFTDLLDVEPMDVKVVDESSAEGTEAEGARKAITHYRLSESLAGGALIELQLETGLRNQIRVQLAHHGLPLLGERKYHPERPKAQGKERIFLHAKTLGFRHPITKASVRFEADIPPDLRRWKAALKRGPAPKCPVAPRAKGR